MTPTLSRDTLRGEALFILKSLRDNGRLGRSNKLSDVKSALELAVSLDFDAYFFFLRKFHYIAMDREAQLMLTEDGDEVVEGGLNDRFLGEVAEFFADQLDEEPQEPTGGDLTPAPEDDFLRDEKTTIHRSSDDVPEFATSPLHVPLRQEFENMPLLPPSSLPSLRPSAKKTSAEESLTRADALLTGGAQAVYGKGAEVDPRYTKTDALGQGPLGTVYRARNNSLGLDVAIKELKDVFGYFSFLQRSEVIKRMRKELCAQAQVRHSGVVAILDQSADAPRPYFVMEMCSGSIKEQLTQANGQGLPFQQVMRWFLQAVYGLQMAHQQGLTHHNLKPENILLDAYGNAKLSDFGLARVIEVDLSKGLPQVFVGTGGMAYLAPELIQRSRESGPAADVYALGIILYEMLTGQIPGRRSHLPSKVRSDAPPKLDTIFDKMTQDRVADRYPDMNAVLEAFYGAFAGGEYLSCGDLILSSKLTAFGAGEHPHPDTDPTALGTQVLE